MEYQMELEREAPPKVSGRFIRLVERTTGRDIFPHIDDVAKVAEQNQAVFADLAGEIQRAYYAGERGLTYTPKVQDLSKSLPVQETGAFLYAVYEAGKSQAPQKPTIMPSTTPVGLPASIRYWHS